MLVTRYTLRLPISRRFKSLFALHRVVSMTSLSPPNKVTRLERSPTHKARRIALVQFDSKLGQVEQNIAEATALTKDIRPGSVDLLCFPEMAFTGYSFPDLETITPFLEHPEEGPTYRFCSSLAKRLRCHIAVGYPEKISIARDIKDTSTLADCSSPPSHLAANSALIISPDGSILCKYRKTNLFEFDVPWAQPGDGYAIVDLPPPLGRVALGICMDLNPMTTTVLSSDDSEIPYELADHVIKHDAQILILLANWLDPKTELDDDIWSPSTINYWANRIWPMFKDHDEAEEEDEAGKTDEILTVVCNRTGTELGVPFVGTSLIFRTSRSESSIKIVTVMKRKEIGVRICEC